MAAAGRLTERGAVLQVVIRNEPHWQRNLVREAEGSGLPVPGDERGLAVLDTGAAMSMALPAVLDRLNAMPDKAVRLQGLEPASKWALGGAFEMPARFVEVELVGVAQRLAVSVAAVPFGDAFGDGVIAVIGRDLLDQLTLRWDGPARTILVDVPPQDD